MPSVSSFQIANDHVKTFQSDATSFKEKFKMEGPASVGTDLDKGEAFSQLVGRECTGNMQCDYRRHWLPSY